MRFGINAWFGFALTDAESALLMREAGFGATMLWWGDGEYEAIKDKRERADVYRKQGLEIANAHLPFLEMDDLWLDTLDGSALMERLNRWIGECAECGVHVAVMHLSCRENPPAPNALGVERVKRLLDACERHGVGLALENVRDTSYLGHVSARVASPRLGYCYDSGHENCWSPDVDVLRVFGDKLLALHLHDNDGSDDQHMLPFSGGVDWTRVAAHLKQLGYRGDLTLESCRKLDKEQQSYKAPEAYLAEAMRRAKKLQVMIEA